MSTDTHRNYRPAPCCGNCGCAYDAPGAGYETYRHCRLYNDAEVVRFYVCDAWQAAEEAD